ncbi:MAG: ATP-binding cassette domain-containing protein, partial [Selenomonas sp.]
MQRHAWRSLPSRFPSACSCRSLVRRSSSICSRRGFEGSDDMGEILKACALSLGYGKAEIVHEVTASVRRAEIASIIGPNGSGKSTLLKALARLLEPRAG